MLSRTTEKAMSSVTRVVPSPHRRIATSAALCCLDGHNYSSTRVLRHHPHHYTISLQVTDAFEFGTDNLTILPDRGSSGDLSILFQTVLNGVELVEDDDDDGG
jgi:hypothetical protein